MRPRLAPWAPVVVVSTRWSEADLMGRMIAQETLDRDSGVKNYDKWTIVNIPAQADYDPEKGETDILGREPGEFMVSARGRTRSDWEATKAATASRYWISLYQGKPSPDTGNVWLREWWRRYDEVLWVHEDGAFKIPGYDVSQSWDCTFRDTKSSDYVVGQVWAKKGSRSYLIYQVRRRLSFTATIDEIKRITALFPHTRRTIIEGKANGDAVIDSLEKEISGIITANPTKSKTIRAEAVSPFIRAGNVWLPNKALSVMEPDLAWDVDQFIEEASGFPHAAHDDAVDAASQYLQEAYLVGSEATVSSPLGQLPRKRSTAMPRLDQPSLGSRQADLTRRVLGR
jgi:predicted phage terminase large subunit-like protein